MSGYSEMEGKWQAEWSKNKLDRANTELGKPKFMLIFAYPGVTGFLHVGHLRGYTYVDAIGRYKRMTGYNVMFPVGTHATGNGAITLASRVANKDEDFIEYLLRNGCPKEKLNDLKDPMKVVDYFNEVYVNDYWKRFGFLADWRRFTCTLYPDYTKFIQWQFKKLNEQNLLIQKPYYSPTCPVHGPVAVDASETDISKGGNAEVQEYTLLKFKHGKEYLVAATLRPETVYGQVCFWVNPDVEYTRIKKGGETWIVSKPAAEKLQLQKDGVTILSPISGKDMIGWTCEAPMLHKKVPVLPASFSDPNVGSGLVTSVPSDAPDDWISLEALKTDTALAKRYGLSKELLDSVIPVSIISIEGYGEFPAQDIIKKMGITQPGDPRLDEAKKQVYKDGYHMGRMKDICGKYGGMRVEEAKDKMKQAMIDSGEAELFFDLTEEVVCRCGQPVRVKRIDDQWFINYGDESLTERTDKHCYDMEIYPPEFYENVHSTLKWFRERACVRQGNWLGTKFPYDEKWIIEAISDSTLYPLYYIISIYANEKKIVPENMTEEFFDHVVLGKGDVRTVSKNTGVSEDLLKKIRRDVKYWYPLDINLGGKEHMTVHFPVYLFNHSAILPDDMLPKGIIVNWYITGKKNKISKSKGGAQPIPGAVEQFGVDALRLYYAHVASMFVDVEWSEDIVITYRQRLDRIMGTVEELLSSGTGDKKEIDRWLISRFNGYSASARAAMEKYDLRQMATAVYFEMLNDIKWYGRRGGKNKETISEALRIWISMMTPITPHTAEEMWSRAGFKGLVSSSQLPEPGMTSSSAEYGEGLIRDVMSDITQIKKVTSAEPKRIFLYTTPSWKTNVMKMGLEMTEEGKLDIPTLTKKCMADEELRKNGKAVTEFVKKVVTDLSRSSSSSKRDMIEMDEYSLLTSAKDFLKEELGAEVDVFSADDEKAYDPQNKSRAAVPGRPAIYLE
ncbi:leucine--tRNA ligase [Candidatus Methanoplasma termitum]|uniref:Leucine--tRNA ligase n=1 Tax=Candidatus Methanoplasma termitum TaxID=1577791 RepID=A0A0A7LDL4_9ARCH|nr:leucine--tRNA ligase [Candidatus Methanoplasma termitum]AIZ56417.1 leucine--tRNA ligase [Candidatus Methanoplasma termitum]